MVGTGLGVEVEEGWSANVKYWQNVLLWDKRSEQTQDQGGREEEWWRVKWWYMFECRHRSSICGWLGTWYHGSRMHMAWHCVLKALHEEKKLNIWGYYEDMYADIWEKSMWILRKQELACLCMHIHIFVCFWEGYYASNYVLNTNQHFHSTHCS